MATAWFSLEISRSLTGATASAAADVAFDVTMSAGAAETVTTGGGADTVTTARITDNANTGAGNDAVTIGTDHTTGVVNGGAGTDTLAFTDRDISGSTTITAFEAITRRLAPMLRFPRANRNV